MRIGVILSGCGSQDGSEVHEATLTLLYLDRADVNSACFAPDKPLSGVVDHRCGKPALDVRNVLTESARIARGKIQPLSMAKPDELDGLILPGGFGAAKNLSTFADLGERCKVDSDLERLLLAINTQDKPIGAICIAPVILARVFGSKKPVLTIGNDPSTAKAIEAMGAVHRISRVDEVVVDERLKFVTTPAYMLAQGIAEVATGIERLTEAVVRLARHTVV